MHSHTVLVAYGNRLRGDDGVGPIVGENVKAWGLAHVEVLTAQQLVPELIDVLKHAQRLLFVDAALPGSMEGGFHAGRITPARSRAPLGHQETPGHLLALLQDLEGVTPEAWLVTIAGLSFAHGERISKIADENMQDALAWIRCRLTEQPCTKSA